MTITSKITQLVIATGLALSVTSLAAAPYDAKNDVKTASLDDARCKKEVSQYREALHFVRQSAGDQVSTRVMNNYVSVGQLDQLVADSGHCAGAQLLREKRANR